MFTKECEKLIKKHGYAFHPNIDPKFMVAHVMEVMRREIEERLAAMVPPAYTCCKDESGFRPFKFNDEGELKPVKRPLMDTSEEVVCEPSVRPSKRAKIYDRIEGHRVIELTACL